MLVFEMNVVQFIVYFYILTSVLLFCFLIFAKKNKRALKWISFLLLALAANFLSYTIIPNVYRNVEWFTITRIPTLYSFGLIIYFYVKSLTEIKERPSRIEWFGTIPFFLDVIYTTVEAFYIAKFGMHEKGSLLYVHWRFLIREGGSILYNFTFFLLAYKKLRSYETTVKEQFSALGQQNLNWLTKFLHIVMAASIIHFGYFASEVALYPNSLSYKAYYPLWLLTIGILLVIGYRSVLADEISFKVPSKKSSSKTQNSGSTSSISNVKIEELSEEIKNIVESGKLYLKADLKLSDLSDAIQVPAAYISQAINRGLHTNFYDFINRYRVMEVIKRLENGQGKTHTLIAISQESGFKSKTAFNTAFKKHTGKTPRQYRQK